MTMEASSVVFFPEEIWSPKMVARSLRVISPDCGAVVQLAARAMRLGSAAFGCGVGWGAGAGFVATGGAVGHVLSAPGLLGNAPGSDLRYADFKRLDAYSALASRKMP